MVLGVFDGLFGAAHIHVDDALEVAGWPVAALAEAGVVVRVLLLVAGRA